VFKIAVQHPIEYKERISKHDIFMLVFLHSFGLDVRKYFNRTALLDICVQNVNIRIVLLAMYMSIMSDITVGAHKIKAYLGNLVIDFIFVNIIMSRFVEYIEIEQDQSEPHQDEHSNIKPRLVTVENSCKIGSKIK